MHTTTPGKAKGKLIKFDQDLMKKMPLNFDGAYSMNVFYEAYMDTNDRWYKARILSCRLARGKL